LPIYRQHQIYLREEIEIAQSTMTGWAGKCSRLLQPLIESLQQDIFSSNQRYLPLDLARQTGRILHMLGMGGPYGETEPPAVCYFYSPDPKGQRQKKHF